MQLFKNVNEEVDVSEDQEYLAGISVNAAASVYKVSSKKGISFLAPPLSSRLNCGTTPVYQEHNACLELLL